MQRYLSKEGFRVAAASGGAEGCGWRRQLRPDAITLDVMMPEHGRLGVLTALKGDPEVADIPVIMLTIVDDRKMGYALGASEYLTKPIDRERLLAVLKKYTGPQSAGDRAGRGRRCRDPRACCGACWRRRAGRWPRRRTDAWR